MAESEHRAFVERFYAALAAGEAASATGVFADDLVWVEPPYPGHAGGEFRGKANVLERVLAPFLATWHDLRVVPSLITPTHSGAIVHGLYRGSHHRTTRSFEARFIHTWEIRDGLARRFEMLADTVPMFRAAAGSEQASPPEPEVSPWRAGVFRGKSAIVTGSGRGIGQGIARFLASHGAHVTLAARTRSELDETIASVPGGVFQALACDLTTPGTPKHIVDQAAERFGAIDILVTNAGAAPQGSFLDLNAEDWPAGFSLKMFANLGVIKEAWPLLKRSSGHVVMIGGGTARTPERHLSLVSAVNGG